MNKKEKLDLLKIEDDFDVEVQFCNPEDCNHDCEVKNVPGECDSVLIPFT